MFNLSQVFSSYSVKNLQQAKDFYGNTVGLPVEELSMGLLIIKFDAHKWVLIYEKNSHSPASYTILNFPVANIEVAVDSFISRGIQFEQYQGPIPTNEKGICSTAEGPKIAWFKYPFGNILSVLEEIKETHQKPTTNEKA